MTLVNKTPSTSAKGNAAEQKAKQYLEESQSLSFVESNYRWRGGEIDLVMLAERSATLVLVEVRSSAKASPWLRYSLSPTKRLRLIRSAQEYRLKHSWSRRLAVRFDVAWVEDGRIEHWPNVLMGG